MSAKTATPAPPAEKPIDVQKRGTDQYVAANKERREQESTLEDVELNDPQVARQFQFHNVEPEQKQAMDKIRAAGAAFSEIIKNNARNCSDRAVALQHVRIASMFANQCITLRGR